VEQVWGGAIGMTANHLPRPISKPVARRMTAFHETCIRQGALAAHLVENRFTGVAVIIGKTCIGGGIVSQIWSERMAAAR